MPSSGLVQTFSSPRSLWSVHPSLTSPPSNSRKRWYLLDFKYQMTKINALSDSDSQQKASESMQQALKPSPFPLHH